MVNALLDEFAAWASAQPIYPDMLGAFDRIDSELGSERTLTIAEYQAVCCCVVAGAVML